MTTTKRATPKGKKQSAAGALFVADKKTLSGALEFIRSIATKLPSSKEEAQLLLEFLVEDSKLVIQYRSGGAQLRSVVTGAVLTETFDLRVDLSLIQQALRVGGDKVTALLTNKQLQLKIGRSSITLPLAPKRSKSQLSEEQEEKNSAGNKAAASLIPKAKLSLPGSLLSEMLSTAALTRSSADSTMMRMLHVDGDNISVQSSDLHRAVVTKAICKGLKAEKASVCLPSNLAGCFEAASRKEDVKIGWNERFFILKTKDMVACVPLTSSPVHDLEAQLSSVVEGMAKQAKFKFIRKDIEQLLGDARAVAVGGVEQTIDFSLDSKGISASMRTAASKFTGSCPAEVTSESKFTMYMPYMIELFGSLLTELHTIKAQVREHACVFEGVSGKNKVSVTAFCPKASATSVD